MIRSKTNKKELFCLLICNSSAHPSMACGKPKQYLDCELYKYRELFMLLSVTAAFELPLNYVSKQWHTNLAENEYTLQSATQWAIFTTSSENWDNICCGKIPLLFHLALGFPHCTQQWSPNQLFSHLWERWYNNCRFKFHSAWCGSFHCPSLHHYRQLFCSS